MAFYAAVYVDGQPKATPRVRFNRNSGHAFTPASANEWKRTVQIAAKPMRPASPLQGPVSVSMEFYLPRPKKEAGDVPTGKPDLDNLAKAVLDCLTDDGWWSDDAVVTDLVVRKHYGTPGATIIVHG